MSDKKEQILAQIRSRYESKYGSSDIMKQVITSEISKISKKKKINFEDLSELESKISSASKTASLLTTHESTLPNKFLSPKNIRAKKYKIEPIRSIANSPLGEHPNSTNNSSDDKSPTSNFKHSANVSASNIVLPPISPTYLTPMELKILKSHGNPLKNSKFLLDSSVEENNESSIALSKSTNLSPIRKDNSADFRLPAGLKGQEREKRISQNIWKKIDELNMKKAEEEENKKTEKLKNKKQEWVEILNKQISDKKEKASLLKNKDVLWSQKSVEIDLQLKIDEQEKEKMHKRKMQSLERENFAQIFFFSRYSSIS